MKSHRCRYLARPALSALLYLLLAACAATPQSSAARLDDPTPLILVSLDGFHPDYLLRGLTPTLNALAKDGVRAQWMRPSYPSLTFPNHYTLVTGLRPDRHGIVNNTMVDADLGRFALHDRAAVEDGRWWGGEPVWVTAERRGLRTATMFWPGSEAEITGLRPRDWLRFDKDLAPQARIDTVLGWLDRDPETRPVFMTLYFEHVDTAGHEFGPGAHETNAAIALVDAALARLLAGLDARGLRDGVNLIISSDHGMAETSAERVMIVDDLVDPASVTVRTLGEVVGLDPMPGHVRAVEAALIGRHSHAQCWRKSELPERWHYGQHPRVPAIICQADPGWKLLTGPVLERWQGKVKPGAHGFDPEHVSMRALFIAHGPAFRSAVELPAFDNVHVYPLLARLLGIRPLANDGDPAVLAPALRASARSR